MRNALKALSNEKRLAVLVCLLEEGEKSKHDLRKTLEIQRGKFNNHIVILLHYKMIKSFWDEEEWEEWTMETHDNLIHFKISELGKKVVNNYIKCGCLNPPEYGDVTVPK